MQDHLLSLLRCPVTRSKLELHVLTKETKKYSTGEQMVIKDAILFAENGWFYPVINSVPRMLVESFLENEAFLSLHLPDYAHRCKQLKEKYAGLIRYTTKKNKRTKKSFTQEWGLFNYDQDKTWEASGNGLLHRFLEETDETVESIRGKMIFDAGCGNGQLNQLIAGAGAAHILGIDLSLSVVSAHERNTNPAASFVQGDVQFPPVAFSQFDIVHSSGVLIHTNNTELSFSCIEPCVKPGGKLSTWLYHPNKDRIHRLFNVIRRFTSRLPVRLQYYLYLVTIFPLAYIIKRLKGNKQNKREMMIEILDWFSPEFRWEHSHEEATSWFAKRNYHSVKLTTSNRWGFNITGKKGDQER